MDKGGEVRQEEEHSLQTSMLAGQIDRTILPYIHFLPANGSEQKRWHISGRDNLYWKFFHLILLRQSIGSDQISQLNRQSFLNRPFHEQLTAFELSQQLTKEQSRIRWQIAIDILSAIRAEPKYRKCDAFVFGSLYTGLSKPTSDIDISVDIDGDNGQTLARKSKEERTNIILDFRKAIELIRKNARSPHNPAWRLFSKARVSGKNIEYIQLREAKTKITVDLSFDTQLCIRHTKLLKFYMEFEPRTKQLIIFLNYWNNFHRLSRSFDLKHWAWTLLILVFLMEKKMIPSALLLQAIAMFQRSERGEMNNQDAQEPYFCDDPEVISKYFAQADFSVQTSTQEESTENFLNLLTDFFRMVETTEFSISLVSPQLGQIVEKNGVAKALSNFVDALPTELRDCWNKLNPTYLESINCFSENEAFFIQDPFQPGYNSAKMCTENTRVQLVKVAKHTLSILRGNPTNFLDFLVLPSQTPANELGAVALQPEVAAYIKRLVHTFSKPESEVERVHKVTTAKEILRIFGQSLLIPDGLFENPEQFDAIRPSLSTQFFYKYMVSLYSGGLLGGSYDISSWQITWQITALWRFFTSEFLKDFFRTGLGLTLEEVPFREVDGDCPLTSADIWTYDDRHTQMLIQNWRKEMVNQLFDAQRIQETRRKVKMLLIPENVIKYRVFKLKVTYPFWKRKCVVHNMQNCSVHEEAQISLECYQNHFQEASKTSGACAFLPFFIYVLYKLDARADEASQVCGVSSITFLVQDVSENDLPHEVKQERKLARKCVVDTLQRTFESYQLRRLANWSENGMDILNTQCCSRARMI